MIYRYKVLEYVRKVNSHVRNLNSSIDNVTFIEVMNIATVNTKCRPFEEGKH